MPASIDATSLVATLPQQEQHQVGSTVQIRGNSKYFTDPVVYKVIAANGQRQIYCYVDFY